MSKGSDSGGQMVSIYHHLSFIDRLCVKIIPKKNLKDVVYMSNANMDMPRPLFFDESHVSCLRNPCTPISRFPRACTLLGPKTLEGWVQPSFMSSKGTWHTTAPSSSRFSRTNLPSGKNAGRKCKHVNMIPYVSSSRLPRCPAWKRSGKQKENSRLLSHRNSSKTTLCDVTMSFKGMCSAA